MKAILVNEICQLMKQHLSLEQNRILENTDNEEKSSFPPLTAESLLPEAVPSRQLYPHLSSPTFS